MSLGAADTSVCATSWLRSISPTIRNPRATSGVRSLDRTDQTTIRPPALGFYFLPFLAGFATAFFAGAFFAGAFLAGAFLAGAF